MEQSRVTKEGFFLEYLRYANPIAKKITTPNILSKLPVYRKTNFERLSQTLG